MHPMTQVILSFGVLALVGLGGYAVVNGMPSAEREPTAIERLRASSDRADKTLCRANMSRDWNDLSREGRANRVRCLAD